MELLTIFQHRNALVKTSNRLASGEVILGFVGGSITADYPFNWPNGVTNWFVETFPRTRIIVENAAIGATGSDSACFRAERELIQRNCDLTFVEYAVNDYDDPTPRRNRSREGLIRKLLAAGQEVVLVYTFRQEFYEEMIGGRVPPSIAEFEVLATHYDIGSVWVGLAAMREVCAGRMKWEEWLPDGLHPEFRGSWSYAQTVTQFLKTELREGKPAPFSNRISPLPSPIFENHWQNATILPLSSVRTKGPWVLKRLSSIEHLDQALETNSPGAELEFDFEGHGLVLIFQYGKRSAEFCYRIDGGEWIPVVRPRYDWSGDRNMVRATFLTEELPAAKHLFEMVVTHGNRPDCTGTECRLGIVGILN